MPACMAHGGGGADGHARTGKSSATCRRRAAALGRGATHRSDGRSAAAQSAKARASRCSGSSSTLCWAAAGMAGGGWGSREARGLWGLPLTQRWLAGFR